MTQKHRELEVVHLHDQGLKLDKQTVRWYRKAADQGLAKAQYLLALMYAEGMA